MDRPKLDLGRIRSRLSEGKPIGVKDARLLVDLAMRSSREATQLRMEKDQRQHERENCSSAHLDTDAFTELESAVTELASVEGISPLTRDIVERALNDLRKGMWR